MPDTQEAQPRETTHHDQTARLARETNGFAIASLVLGIVWLWGLGSVLALVFGYLAKSQIDESRGAQGGRGLAVAGIVLGWVGVGLIALAVTLFLLGAFTMPWGPMMGDGHSR